MTDNCLICLDAVLPATDCVMRCPSGHFLHARCMIAMLVKMGTDKCPYCLKPIPLRPRNMRPPSVLARVGVILEHAAYELMLLVLLFFSSQRFPVIWRLNRNVSFLRLRYTFLDRHYDGVKVLREWALGVARCVGLALVLATVEWALSCVCGRCVDVLAMALYCGLAMGAGYMDEDE